MVSQGREMQTGSTLRRSIYRNSLSRPLLPSLRNDFFETELQELKGFCKLCRVEPLRTMREFAEQEIIIPDGPYKGRRFNCKRQPFSRLWFDLIDSGEWQRNFACGPTQSGKTLCCFVIPAMYHLFEIGESVVCGLPKMDIAYDKWTQDFLPAIKASRYADLLPDRGIGSKGGKFNSITFGNGATLKFMSGGGDDKARSAFTARVVVLTEVDGMDQASETSREADAVTQIEARTNAYGARKRIYGECTVSIEEGRIWQEKTGGTNSRIALLCPHCHGRVSPERPDLAGWSEAKSDAEAEELSHFQCPECKAPWSEQDRRQANLDAIVLHEGEEIRRDEAGEEQIVGEAKRTKTLGFRWSGVNNLFLTAGDIGIKEYKARDDEDSEGKEKELLQFYWSLPHKPNKTALIPLSAKMILDRISVAYPRAKVPDWTKTITVGCDVGLYLLHWTAIAWGETGKGHVVDYNRIEVPTAELGKERGIINALNQLKTKIEAGFEGFFPSHCWVDCGFSQDLVLEFMRTAGTGYRPAKGFGAKQYGRQTYREPKSPDQQNIQYIGEQYHIVWWPAKKMNVVEVNVDHWKSFVHSRWTSPKNGPVSMSLFDLPDQRDHISFSKHLTAERQVEEFEEGKGLITRWEAIREQNHWLDATMLAAAAGHLGGIRLFEEPVVEVEPVQQGSPLTMPDGRPFLITERRD